MLVAVVEWWMNRGRGKEGEWELGNPHPLSIPTTNNALSENKEPEISIEIAVGDNNECSLAYELFTNNARLE